MPKHKLDSLEQSLPATSGGLLAEHKHKPATLDMQHELSQPATKRRRVPHLNFSIESMMQPESQQPAGDGGGNFFSSAIAKQQPVSRSPSPGGLSEAGSASSGSTGTLTERGESQARLSRHTSSSNSSSSNNNNNNNHHHHHQHPHYPQHHSHQHHQHQHHHHQQHNHGHLRNDTESLSSSQSSSRVSTPISPGWNHEGSPACENGRQVRLGGSSDANNKFGLPFQQHLHSAATFGGDSSTRGHGQAGASSSSPSASATAPAAATSSHFRNQKFAPKATGGLAASPCAPNGSLAQVECVLDNKDMWDKFHSLNTEMIITKTGRRMFPVLKVQFLNLDPSAKYAVSMSIVPVDNKRYRYAYHKSCWQVAGKADPSAETRIYPHPDSPFNGDLLSRQVISFEKVKLTNNEMDKSGHIILNSMHKYQPQVHLIKLKSQPAGLPAGQISLGGKLLSSSSSTSSGASSRIQQQQQQAQPAQLEMEDYRTFVFSETVFTAVTAYQNQLITKMKIDKNPFAKGFRDSSRLSDLDRNDPFDYMGALGPAAAAAAAAACAAGRTFGPGSGPGVPPPGPGQPFPPGALEAAAAAAAAGLPPGHHQGQMDQAYAQLLAASAAAQNPWYPTASGAGSNPFGASAAACSTAQAAQHLQTQLWLAAFSACLNNGGQPNPPTPLVGPTPPPPPPGTIQINSNISSPAATPSHERRCEGRSSG